MRASNQVQSELLKGQIAVVTGGGRGNGAAIAVGLAKAGARVAVVDLDEEEAQAAAKAARDSGSGAIALTADVSSEEDCTRAAGVIHRELGAACILINNAGILLRSRVGDSDFVDTFELQHRVNTLGSINMINAFLPALKATKGKVINLASTASFRTPLRAVGYAASKAAVMQMTRALAVELGPVGIRVNAIAPGLIVTRMSEDIRGDAELSAGIMERTPLRRWGDPDDLVGPAVFLASDASAYVTGCVLPVDGGTLAV